MARGGINKALVAKAREAVLARGENPSIDAVRIELGNTGAKSTIHRYLKELEEEESTRLDDEVLLSQPIKELIARLASRLQEEARELVDESKVRYEHQLKELSDRCAVLSQKLAQWPISTKRL
jgi:SOS-response transcriptional repressor LexA